MAFYQKPKISVSEKPDNTPYTLYNFHSNHIPIENINWNTYEYIQTVSIDPAIKTYSIRVERWYNDKKTVIPLIFEKVDLTNNREETFDIIIRNLTNLFDKYIETLKLSHFFFIERQQIPQAYKTVRISQHTISLLMTYMKDIDSLPFILELDPKLKGKMLNIPKGLNYNFTKKWSIDKGIQILSQRKDRLSLEILEKISKKDDLTDTICQCVSILKLLNIYFEHTKDDSFLISMRDQFVGDIPMKKIKNKQKLKKCIIQENNFNKIKIIEN